MHISRPFRGWTSTTATTTKPLPTPSPPKSLWGSSPSRKHRNYWCVYLSFRALIWLAMKRGSWKSISSVLLPGSRADKSAPLPNAADAPMPRPAKMPPHPTGLSHLFHCLKPMFKIQLCSLHCQGLAVVTYCFGSLSENAAWLSAHVCMHVLCCMCMNARVH